MVTFKDIASLANVSKSTVSHVINKTRFVKPETKEKVLKAMRELDYHQNLLARGLATGRTHTIGLLITDIKNPFYPELIEGIEEVAFNNNYNIFLCNTNYERTKADAAILALIHNRVAGIIDISEFYDNNAKKLINSKIPFVTLDWDNASNKINNINIDFYPGMKEAILYLIKNGHKKIFFISGPPNTKTSVRRIEIFKNILDEFISNKLSLTYDIIEGNGKIIGGILASQKILKYKTMPDAIMCTDDITAIGVIKGLKSKNIKIPNEISIIGIDNISLSEIISPTLTTIQLERYEIGKAAMNLLLKMIRHEELPHKPIEFGTKLIVRQSVAPKLG